MRSLALAGLLIIGACLAQPVLTVPAGTRVALKLISPLSTSISRAGDTVRAETAFPVAVGARVPIPTGT
jgi:hypothetical protein